MEKDASPALNSSTESWLALAKIFAPTLPALLGVLLAFLVGQTFAEADNARAQAAKSKPKRTRSSSSSNACAARRYRASAPASSSMQRRSCRKAAS